MIYFAEGCLWVLRFMAGACLFSFLNVVIDRLPRGESVVKGRSHCMSCGHVLSAGELFPIFSFLALRGRCKSCGEKIPCRSLIIECLGGAAFVCCGVFYGTGAAGLLSLRALVIFVYLAVLMAVAVIDWDTQTIYDRFHIVILLLGAAAVWLFPAHGIIDHLIGAVCVSLPMFLLALVIPGAFGGGDVKLMAASGFLLGTKAIICAMFLGLLFGGVYCIALLAAKKIARKDQFAFGPFLAAGLTVAAFFGDGLVDGYLKLFFNV